MEEHVAVGVGVFALVERNDDTSEHQFSSGNEPVHIIAQARMNRLRMHISCVRDFAVFRRTLYRHHVSFVFCPNLRVVRVCCSVVFRFAVGCEQARKIESLRRLYRRHPLSFEVLDDKALLVNNFLRIRRRNRGYGGPVFERGKRCAHDNCFADERTRGVVH